jgi:hypothetical protein
MLLKVKKDETGGDLGIIAFNEKDNFGADFVD